jgi:hypothetical protein
MYKCITKTSANGIRQVLQGLIGEQQTTFVEKTRIGDNILLYQEPLRNFQSDPVNHLILSFVILIASDWSAALYRTVP